MKNHHLLPCRARQTLEPLAQVDLLRNEQLTAESTNRAKRLGIAKNERSREPVAHAAGPIPDRDGAARYRMLCVQLYRSTAGNAPSRNNLVRHFAEQRRVWIRVRVHEDKPVAAGRRGAAISRASDLIDRLKDNLRSGGACDLRRSIRGVVVANDQLGLPSTTHELCRPVLHAGERMRDEAFLIECRDDDRDLHALHYELHANPVVKSAALHGDKEVQIHSGNSLGPGRGRVRAFSL